MEAIFLGLLVAGSGAFSLICAALDAEWFMNARKARGVVSIFGRQGARAFYIILGLILVGVGIGFATGVIPLRANH